MALQIEILTPSKVLYKAEAEEVVAPATEGEVGILPQHAAYITTLKAGHIKVRPASGPIQDFEITGGLLTVVENKVTLLADAA